MAKKFRGSVLSLHGSLSTIVRLAAFMLLFFHEVVLENLWEICAYEELRRKKQYGRTVIAAAANKSEAIEVVRALIEEMYQKTGGFDVKSFMKL